MSRVTKEHAERRNEILDTAQRLFNSKGYEKTHINDIVNEIGIAKGTVYYYFKTKEEIFDGIAERYCENLINAVSNIAKDENLNALQKIELMLQEEYQWDSSNTQVFDRLHTWKNLEMNQKILIRIVQDYSPILAKVVTQGVREGVFRTEYPLEGSRLIMTGHRMLFDPAYFSWSKEEVLRTAEAHQDALECTLRANKGSFSFIAKMVESFYGQSEQE